MNVFLMPLFKIAMFYIYSIHVVVTTAFRMSLLKLCLIS